MSLYARLALLSAVSVSVLVGCSNKAANQQAKRDADRVAMQLEDLTNQRNTLKEELDRVRQIGAAAQKDLAAAKIQMEQDKATMARTNSDLAAARSQLLSLEAQKAELTSLKAELAALKAKQQSNASPATAEERTLTVPTTQPNLNK